MTDKKLTDSEIKKALKEILELMCNEGDLQRSATISNALDLINRLQAKVEENEDTIQFADKIYKEQVAENKRLVNAVNRLTNRICDLKEKDETRHKVFETKCEELEIAKAENERLIVECGNQSTLWSKHFEGIFETAKETIKAEAYKEFAERLKENSIATFSFKGVVMVEEIDDLLKEMVGEDK